MSNYEKLNELYRQLNSTLSPLKKKDLEKAIFKLEKKIRCDKCGMRKKDDIYFQ